jgi:thiol-disulfide isomerase/thioredoxin
MSTSWALAITVLIGALGVTFVIGRMLNMRAGMLKEVHDADVNVGDLGLSRTGPTVVHFSAEWCGPCKSVRRVVDEVCDELPEVAHVEIDMDANPEAARRLSVLSLPTTFIFDAHGYQRYRAAGVPKAADLRSALEPLLA